MIRSIRITLAAAAALTLVTVGALQAQDKMKPMDKMSAPMAASASRKPAKVIRSAMAPMMM